MKINDVHYNRFNIPVVISPNVYADSLIEDPVKIFVMINYNWGIGHTGLVVGESEEALLYDPSGGYGECGSDDCFSSIELYRIPRSAGEFFNYPEFTWDDYLSFQKWDGEDIQIIEFTVPRAQAEKITELIYNHGMAGWAMCSDTVFTILKQSGGIFSSLEANLLMREDPWTLRHKLLELYFPSTRGFMTYTIK
ncbi:hypothetical protein AB7179_01190 [Providencia manganoxydans]|uniref:Uncharacterized protein n=2 Tax=Providencia TaxID=586 RepID=A0A1S1HNA7_PROST|nr:hypothetical protein [Providencia stuartii]OHT23312.1 hypothetical protein A3Q29_07835 [Providencia stuartii]QQO63953.1 hypothetical protein JI723_08375 [Providencia manganoxydans]